MPFSKATHPPLSLFLSLKKKVRLFLYQVGEEATEESFSDASPTEEPITLADESVKTDNEAGPPLLEHLCWNTG